MRKILVMVAILVGAVLLLAASLAGVSESGEVVVVQTIDDEGDPHETRLWVADHDGDAWLRAGDPASAWLGHIRARPQIEVARAGETNLYTAVPTIEATPQINDLLRDKYGGADRWIDFWFGRDNAVAIRLVPR